MVHKELLKEVSKDFDKLKKKDPEAYEHAETLLKHAHKPLHKIANR